MVSRYFRGSEWIRLFALPVAGTFWSYRSMRPSFQQAERSTSVNYCLSALGGTMDSTDRSDRLKHRSANTTSKEMYILRIFSVAALAKQPGVRQRFPVHTLPRRKRSNMYFPKACF